MTPQVFRSLEEARGRLRLCALTIGNFDGVHIGHQALVAATLRYAVANALTPAVLTFHPHPTVIVAPERVPQLICTLEQRLQFLQAAGATNIVVLPFTADFARLSPRQFVSQALCDALETKAVFVGDNFRFGRKHRGTAQTLSLLGPEFGFIAQTVQPVSLRGEIISSSVVRRYLSSGNVSRAARLLGRCFSIEGPVVRGHGVGATQTVPTLNLAPPAGQLVPRGVYITETLEPATGRRWESITNCGFRPTFGGDELTIETFLLSPLAGAAPSQIEVRFHRFVREERQFSTPDALRAQILRDVSRAQTYWRRLSTCTRRGR
ncbi:MAG TPA: riboflavin biosynthesis protein RibF [Bryobacteraceae bacterium]|jgi:riboflavin kinase/FMN adenylyltransferase|nr:riboflavin biosynthesis protein RibF [Bryobacteraceae bacterium]